MRSLLRLMLLLTALCGCAARKVVPPPAPAFEGQRGNFAPVTVYLRTLRIVGTQPTGLAMESMRQAVVDYLRAYGEFRQVFGELPDGKHGLEQPAAVLDLVVTPQHTANRTYILDVLAAYPFLGVLDPLIPQWGKASVAVEATLYDAAGRELWTDSELGSSDYSIILYAWYRTRPVEDAYRKAYGHAFGDLAGRIVAQHDAIMASLDAQPPAERTVATHVMAAQDTPLYNGPQLKIAVMPTQLDASSKGAVPKLFDDYVLTAVSKLGNFDVIGQDDINEMLGYEKQKDALGCDEASCMASIGGALGVDLLVAVKLARLERDWAVSCKIINVKSSHVEARSNEFVTGDVKALLERVPQIVRGLFAQRPNKQQG